MILIVLAASVLAGCLGDEENLQEPGGETGATPDPGNGNGEPEARFNYTTASGGDPVRETLDGTTGPAFCLPRPAMDLLGGQCVYTQQEDFSHLFQEGQMVQVRLTVNWTNTDDDKADLRPAACVPYVCTYADTQEDHSQETGDFSSSAVLETGAFDWWDDEYRFGVAVRNAMITGGLDYTLTIEYHPLDNVLAPARPYLIEIPENATLTAQTVSPLREADEETRVGMLVYDENDRPESWTVVEGPNGTAQELPLSAGKRVVYIHHWQQGFIRLQTDRAPSDVNATVLEMKSEFVEVAEFTGEAQVSDSVILETPPGTAWIAAWFDPSMAPGGVAGARTATEMDVQIQSEKGVYFQGDIENTVRIWQSSPLGEGWFLSLTLMENWQVDFGHFPQEHGDYTLTYEGDAVTGRVNAAYGYFER